MEKYLSVRVQTALYISIFFVSLHHVFVYLTNSSVLRYTFDLNLSQVILIYAIASIIGICFYLILLKIGINNNFKKNIYKIGFIEIICLLLMYYFSINQNIYLFMFLFFIHHLITPYIMFNLDSLFEVYTNIQERGHGRGIYLTVWNIPFVIVPLIMSVLTVNNISISYFISSLLLIPFLYIVYFYIKNPKPEENYLKNIEENKLALMLKNFFTDKLNQKAFIIQSLLHLYYGSIVVILPIYLHSVFMFDWNKIGLILACMTAPFMLIQIPFGNMEDKRHNEKFIFKLGLFISILFTAIIFLINSNMDSNTAFLLFCGFLFLSHSGCALIEISLESMFYKHITYKDNTALLMFRMARILPYSLGILALFFM